MYSQKVFCVGSDVPASTFSARRDCLGLYILSFAMLNFENFRKIKKLKKIKTIANSLNFFRRENLVWH